MPINITLTLEHYFTHVFNKGQRFSVISKELAVQVTSQDGWEKEAYIEELPDTDKVVKLWPLDAWLFHKQNNMELVAETKRQDSINANKYYTDLENWKNTVRQQLRLAGKLNEQQIQKVVLAAISPVTTQDFQIRNKLVAKYPFDFKS